MSHRELNSSEINLLIKGLNFAVKEIFAAVEEDINNLPSNKQDDIRIKVYSAVKEAKPPVKQNIT